MLQATAEAGLIGQATTAHVNIAKRWELCSSMYFFHNSSLTLPLVATQKSRSHKSWLQYRFRSFANSDNGLCGLLTFVLRRRETESYDGAPLGMHVVAIDRS